MPLEWDGAQSENLGPTSALQRTDTTAPRSLERHLTGVMLGSFDCPIFPTKSMSGMSWLKAPNNLPVFPPKQQYPLNNMCALPFKELYIEKSSSTHVSHTHMHHQQNQGFPPPFSNLCMLQMPLFSPVQTNTSIFFYNLSNPQQAFKFCNVHFAFAVSKQNSQTSSFKEFHSHSQQNFQIVPNIYYTNFICLAL